jgi:HK97 family phage portal protein
MASKLIAGNTYVLLLYDGRDVVNRMFVLDPRRVLPLVSEDTGDVFYELAIDKVNGVEEPLVVPARYILHDKMVTLWHPLIGVSPLFSAAVSAMTGGRIMINSERFFANMSRASGVLTGPKIIGEKLAARIKREWEENYRSGNIGHTAVLGEGLDYKPLTMTAVDAQLIEQLRWTSEDVSRVYRVPGFMLGDLTKLSYRNSEQMARTYYQGCLQYHLESVELALEKALDIPNDQKIEFDLEPLFRTELDSRYKAYETGIRSGFLTINNARAKEGLPPVPGGDEPLVQMQYVPLSVSVELAKVNLENAQNPPEVAPPSAADTPSSSFDDGGGEDEGGEDDESKDYDDEDFDEDFDEDSRATVATLISRVRGPR